MRWILQSDDDEQSIGTNPLLSDSDGDGVEDGVEIERGRNPAVNEVFILQIINTSSDE
jgi:hypothetical protein